MDTPNATNKRALLTRVPSFLKTKYTAFALAALVAAGLFGSYVLANQQTTATPNGIWLSIGEIKKLPTTGTAWDNVKKAADRPLGNGNISDQTSNHDIYTYAAALVYARTGDDAYRTKAAQAIMSVIGTEKGGRTLALSWNLSAYVIAADLINLPDYNAGQNSTFVNWLRGVRTANLDGKTLISTHEDRPNNWGTGAGASRIAAAIYLNDRADLDRAATVFRGWLGDRAAYSGFSYGDLSFQCDPTKPVGINPAGCKKGNVVVDGAIPDDMRRGAGFKDPPAPTHYPWTALQGAVTQAQLLKRQGFDSYGWSNQAIRRSVQYLYDLSKRAGGDWWATNTAAKWVPWVVNSSYGANFPTTSNQDWGRVMNFTDWTHATASNQTHEDTTPPTNPTNLKATTAAEKNVQLSWTPSTDNVTVTGYEVSRNDAVLGMTTTNTYTDKTAEANQTYTYKVRAFDAAGNASNYATASVTTSATQGDTVPPAAAITKPTAGATITAESTPISLTATDNVGVTKIEIYIDTQLEASITDIKGRTTFNANWNTKTAGNGVHSIEVRAYDAAGNVGKSQVVSVTVAIPSGSNPTPPPDTPTPGPVPPPPGGGQVTVSAAADSRVNQAYPNKNYGGEDFLRIRDDSKDWHSYLKFDVAGLSGAPKSVKLRIFANDGGPDAGTVYLVGNGWTEGGLTWNNKPALSTLIGKSTTGSVNDQSWAEYDVTSRVRGNGTFSFGLRSDDDNSIYFSSREGKNKPVLIIVK